MAIFKSSLNVSKNIDSSPFKIPKGYIDSIWGTVTNRQHIYFWQVAPNTPSASIIHLSASLKSIKCVLNQGWKWVIPVDPLDPLTHRAIWMWPTYDPLVIHMLKKIMYVMTLDMKQYHRFLQDTELVPCTEILRMKSLETKCFKTA